jgi:nucleoside-diphosphate kinase
MAERSLIILKPDTVHRGLIGAVTNRIENRGFQIVAMKMAKISQAKLDEHYGHLTSKPFYPEIVDYMTMGPVVFMIVEGANAVNGMRQLCGATDPAQATMGTVRADFATTIRYNLIHASDSVENAEAEIKRFFEEDEICSYKKIVAI